MKILLVIPSFYPAIVYGGPIFSSLHTCHELSKFENVEVYVSTTNANMSTRLDVKVNQWIEFAKNFFIKYYNITWTHTLSIPMFVFLSKDIQKADVVHIQSLFSVSTIFGIIYSRLFSKPMLISPRGQLGEWCLRKRDIVKTKWLNWFVRPFAHKMVWHATSEQEYHDILALFPHANVKIISNGIDLDAFQKANILSPNEFTNKFGNMHVETDKIIISMGRLQKVKGFDILIDAFVKVLVTYPNAKLFIAGGDEGEEQNLRAKMNQLKLNEKVFVIGPISGQDKVDFLANGDIFVLPSHHENFGNVYVESLAAGTPIVASKNTPWSEVESANCGKWVNNSVDETANAMIEMLSRDREQMRANSKKAAQKYAWKNIAIQFKELFDTMVTQK